MRTVDYVLPVSVPVPTFIYYLLRSPVHALVLYPTNDFLKIHAYSALLFRYHEKINELGPLEALNEFNGVRVTGGGIATS
jgi:hypothetical protein